MRALVERRKGVGATVSLFLAPASGEEMREALSDAATGAVEFGAGG